ncbi:DinB family protein [Sphingobacterium sp. LRF_L2]|uniref:DinB family protein n=1 Tax=Sphingobacterium sp. LRF_L2 TaxID=3369421 RepID=UPI003F637AA9
MEKVFNFIIDARRAFIELIDGLTTEELNHIPEGFNNNIIWNFGHIVVSTQTLCYVRTEIHADATAFKYVDAYKKGSKPTYFVQAEEIAELKEIALASIETIQKAYNDGVFSKITPFETSTYKSSLNSIEDVIITTVGHDNLHFGYAQAQRRALKK